MCCPVFCSMLCHSPVFLVMLLYTVFLCSVILCLYCQHNFIYCQQTLSLHATRVCSIQSSLRYKPSCWGGIEYSFSLKRKLPALNHSLSRRMQLALQILSNGEALMNSFRSASLKFMLTAFALKKGDQRSWC